MISPTSHDPGPQQKDLGAYYTSSTVAAFLTGWAVRSRSDLVCDPSFGGGVFVDAASERLKGIGASKGHGVYGIELDKRAHALVSSRAPALSLNTSHLLHGDFFSIDQKALPHFDAVIGNPPFVRYQRFSGDQRSRALERAAQHGVTLSRLTSSWAPFIVCSAGMLRVGGRLGMVAPAELTHAAYALPVLKFMCEHFDALHILFFERKLFPSISEDTVLVLGERWRERRGAGTLFVHDLRSAEDLSDLALTRGKKLSASSRDSVLSGSSRLLAHLLPDASRELYEHLCGKNAVEPFGAVADVGIGYVTGANDFFHVDAETADRYSVPLSYLLPAIRRGRDLAGVSFSKRDWSAKKRAGQPVMLLAIPRDRKVKDLPTGLQRYLRKGRSLGVHETFKCRTRSPWYSVPHVRVPNAFLSYMSGASAPRLVANDARAVAPNTLHVVHTRGSFTGAELALRWTNSLTALSCELEGHSLGGGMLKLEPTEAERVRLATQTLSPAASKRLARAAEISAQRGAAEGYAATDAVLLRSRAVGLTSADCARLRDAAILLRSRRARRSRRRD